jgi:proline racemase
LNADGTVSVGNVHSQRKAKRVRVKLNASKGARGLSRRSDAKAEAKRTTTVSGDVAYGGNWFFLVSDHGLELEPANIEQLIDFTWRVRKAVNAQGFPEVDHVELIAKPKTAGRKPKKPETPPVGGYDSGKVTRNFVLCPGKAYDRSPCGTGTSAKLACLAADGKLAEGEDHIVQSIIGSRFVGKFEWVDRERGVIAPTITGTAHITAEATLLLDERDPYCWGIGGDGARVSNPPGLRKSIPQSDAARPASPANAGSTAGTAKLRVGHPQPTKRDGLPRSNKSPRSGARA